MVSDNTKEEREIEQRAAEAVGLKEYENGDDPYKGFNDGYIKGATDQVTITKEYYRLVVENWKTVRRENEEIKAQRSIDLEELENVKGELRQVRNHFDLIHKPELEALRKENERLNELAGELNDSIYEFLNPPKGKEINQRLVRVNDAFQNYRLFKQQNKQQ